MKIIDFAYGAGTVRHRSETEHGIIMPSIGKGFHWKGDSVEGIVLVLSSFSHGPRRLGQTMVLALADGCQICNLSYSEKYEIFDADSSLKRESFWDEIISEGKRNAYHMAWEDAYGKSPLSEDSEYEEVSPFGGLLQEALAQKSNG